MDRFIDIKGGTGESRLHSNTVVNGNLQNRHCISKKKKLQHNVGKLTDSHTIAVMMPK